MFVLSNVYCGAQARRACVAIFLIVLILANPAVAQTDDLQVLEQRVVRLADEGKYHEATPLAERIVEQARVHFGLDRPEFFKALHNLAWLYDKQGRYADAEPLFREALAGLEKALGPDDPVVANSLTDLASLLKSRSQHGEAEDLFKRALAIDEKALGPAHPAVGEVLTNLAGLYSQQSRYTQAEPLYVRRFNRQLGTDPPHH